MAKFYGKVGYGETVQTPPNSGVWVDKIVERSYRGDIVRNIRMLKPGEVLNDDVFVSNSISIIADAYAYKHFFAIRYISWAGTLWSVTNVTVERPRLILRLGEVYNGPTPTAAP